jgi:hypothetical protein
MNEQNQQKLYTKYAPLYKGHCLPMSQTCMCWGFACGDGWFNLIDKLSEYLCLEWLYKKSQYDEIEGRVGQLFYPDEPQGSFNRIITIEQVNDARIRMLEAESAVPVATQVKEKFGTLRFYVMGATESQRGAIEFVEMLSGSTCDVCGEPGTTGGKGWISTRCEQHKK